MHEMVWPKEPLGSLAIKATLVRARRYLENMENRRQVSPFSPAGRATQAAMWVQAQDQDRMSVDKSFAAHPGHWAAVARAWKSTRVWSD